MHLAKTSLRGSGVLPLVVLTVLLGLGAGGVGALLIQPYLLSSGLAVPELLHIGRSPTSSTATLTPVDLAERLRRISIPLYARRSFSGTELAERARPRADAIGYGSVITSDGWLATSAAVAREETVMAAIGGRLLEPRLKIEDPRTGLAFLKFDAPALPVVGFEETETLRPGTPLYALDENAVFMPATFAGTVPDGRKTQVPALQDSDRFNRAFRLDRSFGTRAAGGAVLSADGELSGFLLPSASGSSTFAPMHAVRPILSQAFRGRVPSRAALGAAYLDAAETVVSGTGFGDLKGLRLTGDRTLGIAAVRPGSPAADAGLQEGDVLLRFNGLELGGDRDLAELVAEAEPGARIALDVLKDGAERSVEVTIGEEKR